MKKEERRRIPFIYILIIALFLFICMLIIAIRFGAANFSMQEVWSALFINSSNDTYSIIREIRLPREVAAVCVGASLAVSGAIMQGVTRNPLADPGLLGLSAGANAALAIIVAFIPTANYFGIMVACFVGAVVGALLVFGVGMVNKGGFSPFRLVLAGSAISAFLYAIAEGVGVYYKVSKNISMWTAGGMVGTSWGQLKVILPVVVIGIIISLALSKQLTILSLDEEVAVGLGQKTTQIKLLLFIVIRLLTGASVALVGNIVFIGLMIPHIVRVIVGFDYRLILPISAIIGATFMLIADTIGRTIHAPYETPVAAIVAVVGLPFFLVIVRKGGKTFS